MIGAALAVLSAATSAISVVLVRKYSNQSSAFNISLAISWVGMLFLWPLAVVLTDFSLVNLGSILLFALSGVLTPGFVRLLYYQGMKKLGAPVNSSLFSIYPLYTSLLAVLFLSEILAPGNWAGILMVFLGGILVEWSSREADNQNRHSKKDLIYPVLGGIALGVGSILRKSALILFDAPVLGVAVAYTASPSAFSGDVGVFVVNTQGVVFEAGYASVLGCRGGSGNHLDVEFLRFKLRRCFRHNTAALY